MKQLNNYIQEKLIINKNLKAPKIQLRDVSGVNYLNVQKEIDSISWRDIKEHLEKIRYYKNKNSNPQRLVNSIKSKNKLVVRWYLAVGEDWLECAKIFKQAIIDRGYFTEDELDAYILKRYNSYSNTNETKEIYAKYLDEYKIKH